MYGHTMVHANRCTCGRSKSQPWCDGSHIGTSHMPMAWTAEKTGTVKICTCKSTGTPPICDNTHMKLLLPCCGGPKVKVGEEYEKIKH
jgi:CDGSH-type Zn-finger protein